MATEQPHAARRETAAGMTPQRWREIARTVDGALDLAHEDRARFVEEACAGDAELCLDAHRLLDACEQADRAADFLTEPAAAYGAAVVGDLPARAAAANAAVSARVTAALTGRYAVERELGRGGMAVVHLARDLKHDRQVALKVLRPDVADALGAERFLREIETVARLRHPHILPLYDSGEAGGVLYFVMPYVEGESLRDRLRREPRLPLHDALRIAREVADALDFAHRRGVVHRDVKPENILLEAGHAIVADFGIARAVSAAAAREAAIDQDPTLTAVGLAVGTPAYMSPERSSGERDVDARGDIYSLGCVLYEMLAGEPPFAAATAQALLVKHLSDPVPGVRRLRGAVPAGVEQALVKALAKVPGDRFASAAEFAEALTNPAATAPPAPSVAVLPFVNLSADAENDYFADGITEDVIAQLSKVRTLKVISRSSVMAFKKREHNSREIGEKLGVATLVEGSVRRAGNRVRVVAQLIDAATDQHLWAATYDRGLTDIFTIQGDVALQIAAALKAELSPDERARIGKEPTRDLEAYELYLKGRQCAFRYTEEWLRRALGYFDKAIARDPDYALAYAGSALAYVLLGVRHGGGALRPDEAYGRARAAVKRALALDGGLGEAHAMLALVTFACDFDWAGAERELDRAIELNPGSADAYGIRGLLLSALQRYDEAIAAQQRALELDPLATVGASDLAAMFLRAGRYHEAVQEAQRLIELDPGFSMGHSTLGWAYLQQGMRDEGLAALERAVSFSPGNTIFLSQLGQAYAVVGKVGQAREVLRQLDELARHRYVSPYHMAYVYTGLGEQDEAMTYLERAHAERVGGVFGIKGSFLFTTLRPHPRFRALLRKMNLPE